MNRLFISIYSSFFFLCFIYWLILAIAEEGSNASWAYIYPIVVGFIIELVIIGIIVIVHAYNSKMEFGIKKFAKFFTLFLVLASIILFFIPYSANCFFDLIK